MTPADLPVERADDDIEWWRWAIIIALLIPILFYSVIAFGIWDFSRWIRGHQ